MRSNMKVTELCLIVFYLCFIIPYNTVGISHLKVSDGGYHSRDNDYDTGWAVRGSNPVRGKKFFSFLKFSNRPWGPPSFVFSGYGGYFGGVKWPGRDANRSPLSSAEDKNE